MPNWDYFPLYIDGGLGADPMQQDFMELGRKGWELVAVVPYETESSVLVAFFKRELEE
jgi:hypothetical protein